MAAYLLIESRSPFESSDVPYYYSLAQCRATVNYGATTCVPNPGPEWARRGFNVPREIMPRAR